MFGWPKNQNSEYGFNSIPKLSNRGIQLENLKTTQFMWFERISCSQTQSWE